MSEVTDLYFLFNEPYNLTIHTRYHSVIHTRQIPSVFTQSDG